MSTGMIAGSGPVDEKATAFFIGAFSPDVPCRSCDGVEVTIGKQCKFGCRKRADVDKPPKTCDNFALASPDILALRRVKAPVIAPSH